MATTPKAKLSDLVEGLEMQSEENHTYFDRQTGRIVSIEADVFRAVEEEDSEELESLPDWQKAQVEIARVVLNDKISRFIDPPDKFDFHEYSHMERFSLSMKDASASDDLCRAIRGKGAFRYFKDTIHRLGLADQWYRYREEAAMDFVIAWCQDKGIEFEDDTHETNS